MAIGGFDGSTYLKTVEVYDADSNCWRLTGHMNSRRLGGGVGVVRLAQHEPSVFWYSDVVDVVKREGGAKGPGPGTVSSISVSAQLGGGNGSNGNSNNGNKNGGGANGGGSAPGGPVV